MIWRCVAKNQGTCNPEPEWNITTKEIAATTGETWYQGRTCNLTPETCGRFTSDIIPDIDLSHS